MEHYGYLEIFRCLLLLFLIILKINDQTLIEECIKIKIYQKSIHKSTV